MKCLRCRKEAADGASFCEECLKKVSLPLQQSPYLNTQINLNARKVHRAAQAPAAPAPALSEGKKRSRKGLVSAVVILSILCLVLAAGCLYFSAELWLPYVR